ncbi:DUF1858 domain-containing protein [Mesorhizobium sp.]|uniref:DUF1858 domain-containing protein n=1 Tax=Mesorhizobium sp. TaxID=1871066 RepID=UPI000FE4B5CC|nr:DUF1858 domain-containing protein [Mesorhizobium sp.]RWC26637.1 MAG: DUF1858 domain-containing protein [Mesorhizobium sp.]TIX20210.1 MAG: DUF1858 domain-containing protein [Mesorhizobium sp.]
MTAITTAEATVLKSGSVRSDMIIDEIMRKWPATVAVLLDHRMLCVGCPIGTFHSVAEACHEHHVDESLFLADLEAAIQDER